MQLLVIIWLFSLAAFGSTQKCDPECQNQFAVCEKKYTQADCSDAEVSDWCPALCGVCTPCEMVHGGFGAWEKVTKCPKQCTLGDFELKTRECNDPAPMYGGDFCKGDMVRVKKCKGCSDPITLKDLYKACESCDASSSGSKNKGSKTKGSGSGSSYSLGLVDNTIEEYDSSGLRMALRHTANEIEIESFFHFFETGMIDSKLGGSVTGSQYKDPNFHFFWGDADSVKMDIFDLNGVLDAYVTFSFPQGSIQSHPSWNDFFKWDFISRSNEQHYKDIQGSDHIDIEFRNWLLDRNLYLAKSHDGCPNDRIWFTIMGKTGPCWWDKVYRKPGGNSLKTTIVYSPFSKSAHTLTSLAVGSKVEFRIGGDFGKGAQNGFQKVFRYPNQAGVDFIDFYERGVTDSSEDRYYNRNAEVKTFDMYRSDSFVSDISGASQILLVVYSQKGGVAEALTFRGTNNLFSWFSDNNLVSSLKWKLAESDYNFFSIDGDPNTRYAGCWADTGYLIASCLDPTGRENPCGWEDYGGGHESNRGQMCAILYSPGDKDTTWNSDYLIGSAIEIFVK